MLPYLVWSSLLWLLLGSRCHAAPNDIASALTSREGCLNADVATAVSADVVACRGPWIGHIANASQELCAEGFTVCKWEDKLLLRQISWATVTQIEGCFAYNAAQDNDRCLPCRDDDVQSDDMAAVGRGCPHTNFGQTSCLLEGRIDASCCVDSLQQKACQYAPGVTTGILCCRRRTAPERDQLQSDGPRAQPAIVAPATQMVRLVGEKVHLHCPLTVSEDQPLPSQSTQRQQNSRRRGTITRNNVLWLKDGHVLPHVQSASWTISYATPANGGLYACRTGRAGSMLISHVNLTINTVSTAACASGKSAGFHDANNVRGCAGTWKGHVRRAAATLCGRGWKVCTPKEKPFLGEIDPSYLQDFGGCFGYNAAFVNKRCRKCKGRMIMAALGGDCPVNEKLPNNATANAACYGNRKIAAYSDKYSQPQAISGCNYRPGKGITGVLCCRRMRRSLENRHRQGSDTRRRNETHTSADSSENECYPSCRNGGTCLSDGRCLCPKGYSGTACQHGGCSPRCLNGGQCLYGYCKCTFPFEGDHCQMRSAMLNDRPPERDSQNLENNLLDDRLSKKRRAISNSNAS